MRRHTSENSKKFAKGYPAAEDFERLQEELYGVSDRASAVMLSSFTEAALTEYIQGKIRPNFSNSDMKLLFDFQGTLGTFGGKIIMGYALNWFGRETRHDLDLIRLLRNEFAHSRKSFRFTDHPVASVCQQLKSPDWPNAMILKGPLDKVPNEKLAEVSDKSHPRTRYGMACYTLAYGLMINRRGAIPDTYELR